MVGAGGRRWGRGVYGVWGRLKFLGGSISTTTKLFIPFHFTTGTIVAVFLFVFFSV